MALQIVISIDSEVKERFSKLVRAEGKTASQTLRELIENFLPFLGEGYLIEIVGREGSSPINIIINSTGQSANG